LTIRLLENKKRKVEGGLRTQGYFKSSYKDKPLISIITVVYNCEEFLEETILSVINQTYDNVEYIIIDGASSDETVNIIKKYEDKIDYWVSEKDNGIYDAMNKGIDLASNEWINFMNAGDSLCNNNMIENLVNSHIFKDNKDIVTGYVRIIDSNGKWLGYKHPYKKLENCNFIKENCIAHQATFTHKNVFKKIGKFSLQYKIQGDYDFWLKAKRNNIVFKHIEKDIANFLDHGVSSDRNLYEISLREKYNSLSKNQFLTPLQIQWMFTQKLIIFKLKSFIRKMLGTVISDRISKNNLQKKFKNKNIIFDMSIEGATRAGVYVFAYNIQKELSKQTKISVDTFKNPFSSIGKNGIIRKINSLLRLLYMEFIIFKGNKNDIFFFPAPEVPFLFLLFKKKYIIVIHDIFAWKNQNETTFFARLKNKLLPLIAKKAYLIGTVSEFSKMDIVTKFQIKSDKILVLANGLDNNFKSDTEIKPLKRLANTNYILNVSSFEPRKNIIFLIDIFEYIKDKYNNNLKLVLTGGESWSSSKIFSKIANSKYKDEILILGNIPDESLPWLYKNAKIMVFPSKEEGFGIPVIESLSQKTPVIVHKNSALEIFEDYGVIVVNNYNISLWSDMIIDVINKNYRISDFFQNKVIETFSWKKSADTIIDRL